MKKIEEKELIRSFERFQQGNQQQQEEGLLCSTSRYFIRSVLEHGWGKIRLSDESFDSLKDWEQVFADIFNLPPEVLEEKGLYRSVDGVAVGYRGHQVKGDKESPLHDDRDFVECRLIDGSPCPNYDSVITRYSALIQSIYHVLTGLAFILLQFIAVELGLDPKTFTDLTDLSFQRTTGQAGESEDLSDAQDSKHRIRVSSSLLRICRYQGGQQEPVHSLGGGGGDNSDVEKSAKFGSHTDTTFLTLGLTSSTPALELFDQKTFQWIAVEEEEEKGVVSLFLGEYLQLLTSHFLQPSVHRVRDFSRNIVRLSCPFLVRGDHRKTIGYLDDSIYFHPGEQDQDEEEEDQDSEEQPEKQTLTILGKSRPTCLLLPSFQGMKMKLIHLFLEKKRRKCFQLHCGNNNEEEENHSKNEDEDDYNDKWILSAFPVEYMTPEML
jgi:isopenicillin N synthase-like dioxygenase